MFKIDNIDDKNKNIFNVILGVIVTFIVIIFFLYNPVFSILIFIIYFCFSKISAKNILITLSLYNLFFRKK